MVDTDGRRRPLRGRYLVGCDGSRSIVREQAGISQTQRDHDRRMVLLVFRSRGLHDLLERFPGKSFYSVLHPELEGYWQFFGRVDLGNTWFFHAPVPPGTTAENYDFERYLHEAVGAPFEVEFEHVGFWDLRIAMADSYRRGRIFIAGDAAHSHPPYGGFGINTGFEDARNLGWKLAALLRAGVAPGLLDSYDAERRPVFASTARDFIEQAIAERSRLPRRLRTRAGSCRVRAGMGRAWQRRAGRGQRLRAPLRGQLDHPGGQRLPERGRRPPLRRPPRPPPRTATALRRRHRVRSPRRWLHPAGARRRRRAHRRFESAARALGVPLAVIRDRRQGGRERYEAGLVLVRPDHFVAWVGDEVTDAGVLLRRAIGA